MEEIRITAGDEVFVGAPANPFPEPTRDSLRDLVASLPSVLEAHLPQYFVPSAMQDAAKALVVVIKPGAEQETMGVIDSALPRILPEGVQLDVLPLPPGHELLAPVRKCGCVLKKPVKGRWWRLWSSHQS